MPDTWNARLAAAAVPALVLLLTAPSPGTAQSHVPESGTWSISLGLFDEDGGTELGLWRLFGERANVGFVVDANLDRSEDESTNLSVGAPAEVKAWSVTIAPTIKYYLLRRGPVQPYVRTRVGYGFGKGWFEINEDRQRTDDNRLVRLSAAVGAEWFPLEGIGISGHTGWQALRTSLERTTDNGTVRNVTWDTGTFRSGLRIQLYFD